MRLKRIVTLTLVAVMALGAVPDVAGQGGGTIGGKATDEAKKPYSDYAVQLRDVSSGLVVNTRVLDALGLFAMTGVPVPGTYLVELVQVKDKKIVCTEGPYALTAAIPGKDDVNISCGKVPAAIWLLAAGAGAAAAVAVATRSTSR